MPEFTLPPLPYAFDALEPHIDARTMEIHHGRHHQAYVTALNAALSDHPNLQTRSIEEIVRGIAQIPEAIRTRVRNNGGGHYNHALFWEIMKPGGAREPGGALGSAIQEAFGNLDNLKKAVSDAGMNRFGSGWSWLALDRGKLVVLSTANQDTPLMDGHTPILGVDVWEHAYYLKYQNRRADYLAAWWNVVNWTEIGRRYDAATR
ncbi:MAG TPA: superoxide dismutase [Chthonomonadales bacterium]|nr:superoxide dismutase [Chthonomonadales bacterium]